MIYKFCTALAWLWVGCAAFRAIIQFVPPVETDDIARAIRIIMWTIVPIAWLMAVYGQV